LQKCRAQRQSVSHAMHGPTGRANRQVTGYYRPSGWALENTMIASSAGHGDADSDPPIEPTLDLEHLGRMTLGDRNLEREVLQLFDRQTAMMTERLRGASAAVATSSAHTLKGSARGIGAWRLARVAEQLERVVAAGGHDLPVAIERLIGAVEETRSAIARHLD
jgi:HPt (histidine-containing phosphotransfer) domain-containing protein